MSNSRIEEVIKHYPQVTGIHPACVAVPGISQDDYASLLKSISEDGLGHDIVLTQDGLLVDGRNRLIACFEASVEPRFRKSSTDPWVIAYTENIARRHLEVGQKAAFAHARLEHEREEAKKRKQGGQGGVLLPETFPEAKGDSRDKAGVAVGISGKSVEKYDFILEVAPDIASQVGAGSMSLEAGFKAAKKREAEKRSSQIMPEPPKLKVEQEKAEITTSKGVVSLINMPTKPVFNATNNSVDWAAWTWNPVTGCEHGCKFCYAREIANSDRMAAVYPNKFEPTYHPYRLSAPKNTKRPDSEDTRDHRVFVCSMADLFGKWVPDKWIKSVFDSCLASPEWEYLFLTKWPARYSQMPLLKKAWYGASVIQQSDVSRVEKAMSGFETDCVKWISLEPMLQSIRFNDLSWCDLVVIGSQTSTTQPDGFVPAFAPNFDWVVDVVNQCREFDVPYYLKDNLGMVNPGMKLPKSLPRRRA